MVVELRAYKGQRCRSISCIPDIWVGELQRCVAIEKSVRSDVAPILDDNGHNVAGVRVVRGNFTRHFIAIAALTRGERTDV